MNKRYFDSTFEGVAAVVIGALVLVFAYGFGFFNGITHPIK